MSNHCGDVLIHIDENLDDKSIREIEYDISQISGVYSACVHQNARHLMLVDYDPLGVEAGALLAQVRDHGVHAELIGL